MDEKNYYFNDWHYVVVVRIFLSNCKYVIDVKLPLRRDIDDCMRLLKGQFCFQRLAIDFGEGNLDSYVGLRFRYSTSDCVLLSFSTNFLDYPEQIWGEF